MGVWIRRSGGQLGGRPLGLGDLLVNAVPKKDAPRMKNTNRLSQRSVKMPNRPIARNTAPAIRYSRLCMRIFRALSKKPWRGQFIGKRGRLVHTVQGTTVRRAR